MFRDQEVEAPAAPKIKENIFTRIAKADKKTVEKAQAVLGKYGIPKASDRIQLYYKLRTLYKQHKEDVIPDLISIHPDYDVFENYFKEHIDEIEKKHERELKELSAKHKEELKDAKLDLRFANVKTYGDDGTSTGGKAPALNTNNQSHINELLVGAMILGTFGVIALSLVSLNKK